MQAEVISPAGVGRGLRSLRSVRLTKRVRKHIYKVSCSVAFCRHDRFSQISESEILAVTHFRLNIWLVCFGFAG